MGAEVCIEKSSVRDSGIQPYTTRKVPKYYSSGLATTLSENSRDLTSCTLTFLLLRSAIRESTHSRYEVGNTVLRKL